VLHRDPALKIDGVQPTLRKATWEDGEFLYALHRAALGPVVEATWGDWDDAVQRGFHERWFAPERLSVVTVDGQPVGVLDAQPKADVMYLARIELMPAVQRQGMGTELIRGVAQKAGEAGLAAVELDVLHSNEAAQRLFERLGFRVVADNPPKRRMRLGL
jgi:ribosomal protein S18 acetylase RimI-like enzyme